MWVRLKKERFPVGTYGKLKPRADGSFRIREKINNNSFKVDLPDNYGVSDTFNIEDLTSFHGTPEMVDMMKTSPPSWENDQDGVLGLGPGLLGPNLRPGPWRYTYSRRRIQQAAAQGGEINRSNRSVEPSHACGSRLLFLAAPLSLNFHFMY